MSKVYFCHCQNFVLFSGWETFLKLGCLLDIVCCNINTCIASFQTCSLRTQHQIFWKLFGRQLTTENDQVKKTSKKVLVHSKK